MATSLPLTVDQATITVHDLNQLTINPGHEPH
jgi:hypothetical protein